MRIQTERSVVLCAIALKRFALRHGTSPASLEELVPEFLPAVPVDYMDGKPVRYRRQNDGSSILYSVGEDGMDDGGDASLQPKTASERDLWKRKDFVWPAPATPDELAKLRPNAAVGR